MKNFSKIFLIFAFMVIIFSFSTEVKAFGKKGSCNYETNYGPVKESDVTSGYCHNKGGYFVAYATKMEKLKIDFSEKIEASLKKSVIGRLRR